VDTATEAAPRVILGWARVQRALCALFGRDRRQRKVVVIIIGLVR
jgi:hypothetical protein